MHKLKLTTISLLIFALITSCKTKETEPKKEHLPTIQEKIGQMIMVGFRGLEVKNNQPIYEMVTKYKIGGVVLYSRDLPSKETLERNVESPEQLRKLNSALQALDTTKLLISIDEEGGFVTRLSVDDGFKYHKSHQAIAQINNNDSTRLWAKNMAQELSELGINMNFGPVLDMNINPENPIIGARERSFSKNADFVISNAKAFISEHRNKKIICVPKHFPGHGSSDKDSHKGLADVTNTWSEKELIPFKTLIENEALHVIMTSHVYNQNLDTLPSTLSPKIINDLLRNEYGFEGVIISDDMQMRAISNFYDFETSIEKSILAGVDILLFSNNAAPCPEEIEDCEKIPFDPKIAERAITHILKLVDEGVISKERIHESYQRITSLKARL